MLRPPNNEATMNHLFTKCLLQRYVISTHTSSLAPESLPTVPKGWVDNVNLRIAIGSL